MAHKLDNEPRYVTRGSEMSDFSSGSRSNFLKRSESPALSIDNRSSVPRVPPPPPPYAAQFSDYASISFNSRKDWLSLVASFIMTFSWLIFAAGGLCYTKQCKHGNSHHSTVWVGAVLFLNATIGFIAARKRSLNWLVALVLVSTLGLVASAALLTIAVLDWRGIDVKIEGDCVIDRYDATYIRYIYENMNIYKDKFDFVACYKELQSKVDDARISASLSSVIALLGGLEGVLTLTAIVLGLRFVCTCKKRSTFD